jgi:hypothetical protein
MQMWACKSCGAQISEEDLKQGRAVKAGPDTLCARCAPRPISSSAIPAARTPLPVQAPREISPSPGTPRRTPAAGTPLPALDADKASSKSGRTAPLLPAPVPFSTAAVPIDQVNLFAGAPEPSQAPPAAPAPAPSPAPPATPPQAAPRAAPRTPPAARLRTPPPTATPPAPVAPTTHGSRSSRLAPAVVLESEESWQRLLLAGGSCAVASMLLVVLGYRLLAGKPEKKPAPENRTEVKKDAVPPPVEKKAETKGRETIPPPPPKQPEQKPVDTVPTGKPKTAEEAYEHLFDGLAPDDKARRVERLEQFLTGWDDPLYVARANRDMVQLTGHERLDPRYKLEPAKQALTGGKPGLQAVYYRGRDLNDANVVVRRVDERVDFVNAPAAPGVPDFDFSARWTGYLRVEKAGRYFVGARSDDGSRMWVNGMQVVDEWHDGQATRYGRETVLQPGYYTLKLEYYQGGGDKACQLLWSQADGFAEQVMPPEVLFHEEP